MDTTFSHIKAVFCDIDGTLLTSQHTVSPRTVAAIRALRERGVLFGLCTGRDAHATEAMYELWGIEGLVDVMVGCGGAEVIDRAHDVNELSYPLPGETIARICKHMADLPATPVCPRDGVFYVPESNACVEHLSRVDGVPYQVVDFAEFLREPQPKVMFTMAPEVMPRVIERASTFADDTVKAAALQTTQRLYEFMDPRVSKTRGLVRVAELNDMELQDICVFGDADNDTCMVADAGVGVAMANGSDATRAAADFVTASNDKDGIAIFIEEHLLYRWGRITTMGTGASVVASGDLGELIPKICAKIQITLSEHHTSNHRWVKDILINLVGYSFRLMTHRSRSIFDCERDVCS